MLNDDRKTSKPQTFDEHGYSTGMTTGSKKEHETDELIQMHLCGWACKCFVTRLNFLIAGLVFTFAMYMLSETTLFFERTSNFFTGIQSPAPNGQEKSVERFFANHYTMICLFGPTMVIILVAMFYIRHYSRKLNHLCKCSQACGFFLPLRCCSPVTQRRISISKTVVEPTAAQIERSDKIKNRKKTPAGPKRSESPSPTKQKVRRASKSPVKRKASTATVLSKAAKKPDEEIKKEE